MKYSFQYLLTNVPCQTESEVVPPSSGILCGGCRKVCEWEPVNITVDTIDQTAFILWKRKVILEEDI